MTTPTGRTLALVAVLSLLPLGMVGGAGYWLRRRARELDEDESSLDS